jgi:DNA invertase Pin-like site-specific DNA recombinase
MYYRPLSEPNYAEVHIYRRVSTTKQDLVRQDTELKYYFTNYPNAQQWADVGYSGGDRTRPNLLMMTAHLQVPTHKPKLIIVHSIDRLYRDLTGFVMFLERWVLNDNVHIHFVKEGIFLAKENALNEQTRMMYVMLAYMAEAERLRISERTKAKLTALKNQGKTLGRPRDESLDPEITEHYFQGLSTWKSAKILKVSLGKVQRAREFLGYTNDGQTEPSDDN